MKLRFNVPLVVWIIGPSPESLDFASKFLHRGLSVEVSAVGDAPLHSDQASAGYQHFRIMRELIFVASPCGETESGRLTEMVNDNLRWVQLVRVLTSVANRVLRSIRNFGTVPYVNEVKESEGNLQASMERWKVSRFGDDNTWQPLVPAAPGLGGFGQLFGRLGSGATEMPQLRASEWRAVEEAIQEDLSPGPEREFLINAIELLRVENFRMAVMESVIGLEISLARYLNTYLEKRRGLSSARVKSFVNPQLGLTDRVGVLLDLTIGNRLKELVDMEDVLFAVRMRNHVVHKTGHLDPNVEDEKVRKSVNSVLLLTDVLANEWLQIEMDPAMKSLAEEIAKAHSVPAPTIRVVRKHRILLNFWFVGQVPESLNLDDLCLDIGERLVAIDKWLDPSEDLFVRFEQFPSQLVANWHHGKLHRT
jgi:hypothetical protein